MSNCWQANTNTVTVFQQLPSDGVVCSNSQILNDIPQSNVYEAIGVNHSDELNTSSGSNPSSSDVMRTTFNLIWNRNSNDFFHTPTR